MLGIDLSARMLEKATAHTDDARITYRRADLDQLALDGDVFDVAYSSLTVHYLVHLDALLTQVHRSLVPGGHFVFSAEHPVYTAPSAPQFVTGDAGGTVRRVWPLDGYLREGPRVTNWFADGVVKQHRTIGTYLRLLRDAGFTVRDLCEWGPTDEQVAVV